jgi:transcriptional regulator with XRE-family HTH domain
MPLLVAGGLRKRGANMPTTLGKSESNAAIGKRLIISREALGLSPDEVARRLGITRQSYVAWEKGRRQRWPVMFLRLIYIAQLPVSTEFLLSGSGAPLVPEEVLEAALLRHGLRRTF